MSPTTTHLFSLIAALCAFDSTFMMMTSVSAEDAVDAEMEKLITSFSEKVERFVEQEEEEEKSEDETHQVRRDVFEEKRWRPVYSSYDQAAESREDILTSVSSSNQQLIVDLHNKLRRQEGASNMYLLRYNEKLANLGQQWCQRCVFEHGQPPFDPQYVGGKFIGQNIYAYEIPAFKVENAVNAWYDEKSNYQYSSGTCQPGKICGHYTAVTWASTTDVGCGLCYCPSISGLKKSQFIVCNYLPPGNFEGEKPFAIGAPCSQCHLGQFFCNKGLCDSQCSSPGPSCECKAACKRCGTKTNDCRCKCVGGTTGPDCSESCQDKDRQCNQNPGYPPFLCTMTDPNWAFVKDKCPMMCKKCEAPSAHTPGANCRERDEKRTSAMKRLMLGLLTSELKDQDEQGEE